MKIKNKSSYVVAGILLIGIVFVIGSIIVGYNIEPIESYSVDNINHVEDGSFENFNQTPGDCCNANPSASKVYASKDRNSIVGNFCLNLRSENQCACINKEVNDFNKSNEYIVSFYYKGNNPRFCNLLDGDGKCLPNKKLDATRDWTRHYELLNPTEESTSARIYFYADSDGTQTVTNLYDDLQVRKLIPIDYAIYNFNADEQYIIKTKADNRVEGELISEIDAQTGEGYFIVTGKPNVTIQFPWSEVVIILVMMLVIVRLLFKRDDGRVI